MDGARVKYKDIFDLKQFYDDLHEYLQEHDWGSEEMGGGEQFETYYDERVNESGSKEFRIWWRLTKVPKGTAAMTYHLDITFKCLAISDTEIVREGQKMKVQKGEMELTVGVYIEENYKEGFDKSPVLSLVKNLFTKRVYKSIMNQRKKEVYQETYAMFNWIKQWFKLKRYLPYEETKSFFPSTAYPSHLKE